MRIEPLSYGSLTAIAHSDGGNGWKGDLGAWSKTLSEVAQGRRLVLVALAESEVLGYGSLLWQSSYPPFALAGTPEVHDLATARRHRRRGVATSLISALEHAAADGGRTSVGLGVGLYADYGAAQRLYASLGYLPDGHGITCRYQPVDPGSLARVDDDLVLWLTKSLSRVVAGP